jgi:hypothetical protein
LKKFTKGLTAEHAALLAYGIDSHDNIAEFFLWLPNIIKDNDIYFFNKNIKTLLTTINLPKLKKDISTLTEAILLDVEFDEVLFISNSEEEIEVGKIRVIAPFWDEGNENIRITYEKHLLDIDSIYAWLMIYDEPEMAKRINSNELTQYKDDSNKTYPVELDNVTKVVEMLYHTKPTAENIEQFKSSLPDAWEKGLFDGSKECIINPVYDKLTTNKGSTKERDNLFKTIGLLALAFIEQSKSNRFGSKEKPIIDPIAKELEKYLPENSGGLSNRVIRERLSKGLNTLKNC